MSRTERRQQIVEIAHTAQRGLYWNTWKELHPGAAELALPKIREIIDDEIKSRSKLSRRRPFDSKSSRDSRSSGCA